jgi:hypothetical protein
VGVFYHIMTLNNTRKNQQMQLETRQATLFMNVYNRYISSEFRDAENEISKWEWNTFEEFWDKYGDPDRYPDNVNTFSKIGQFYEGLGTLVREDLIEIRLIAQFIGGSFIDWYERWTPIFEELKKQYKGRSWNTEYLYIEVKKFRDDHPELFNL